MGPLKHIVIAVALLVYESRAVAQEIRVHDPVMIKEGDTFYLFCTGSGISVFSSKDKLNWRAERPVFDVAPPWAVEAIPGFRGHIWAPDISFYNGEYYLYYSVSAFGKNTSCIGLATNKTLDRNAPEFNWIDHGKVLQSVPGRDLWNAIDPNLIVDAKQQPWLTFGSFWSGMKLVKLASDGKQVAQPEEWYTVAKRARAFTTDDRDAGEGAVEAPFIFRKHDFYYLFVSFDFCCRGKDSNYKIAVGRSESIQGPYRDKNGVRMDEGGGSIILEGNTSWPGLGHNAVYTIDGTDYCVFHAYDAADNGKPKLKIETLTWDKDGWPVVKLN